MLTSDIYCLIFQKHEHFKCCYAMLLVSYLKISLASVQQDFIEEFHIFFLHQFVRINPGALMEPQVNQVHWVTDTLWQSKQDALCIRPKQIPCDEIIDCY